MVTHLPSAGPLLLLQHPRQVAEDGCVGCPGQSVCRQDSPLVAEGIGGQKVNGPSAKVGHLAAGLPDQDVASSMVLHLIDQQSMCGATVGWWRTQIFSW